jgi:hypothetical protein
MLTDKASLFCTVFQLVDHPRGQLNANQSRHDGDEIILRSIRLSLLELALTDNVWLVNALLRPDSAYL